jgi:hypothetical protein
VRRSITAVATILTVALALPPGLVGAEEPPGPLAAFERLVGGRWYFGETYQVYEWGVGQRALRATAYLPSRAGPKRVSEGFWYFHPESGEIRATFVAIDMGFDLFEYVTSFEGDTMTSLVSVHGPKGREHYIETFEFNDEDHYVWTLWRETPDGREKVMGGNYERRPVDAAVEETR